MICGASQARAVSVTTTAELVRAVALANAGGDNDIEVADGVYTLSQALWIGADGITVRGSSGNRDAVIIEGGGMYGSVPHGFEVAASGFTLENVTVRRVANHGIQVHGELDADGPVIRNVRIQDTFEQMLKVSYDADNPSVGSDNGLVEGCLFEYTNDYGPQWYIGGVDAHQAKGWIIRDNVFRRIRSPGGAVAEHAVHFWSDSQDTLVERNLIVNCDRGIGFGLGDRGHLRGVIRNNMIYHDDSDGFGDVGIGLESSPETQVYNNTIYMEHDYANAVEYRFTATTGVFIANNLTNRLIRERNEASAELHNNVTEAEGAWFVNPAEGDLHLQTAVESVVDQGISISGLTDDFDGESRPRGAAMDVGADEWAAGGVLAKRWFVSALMGLLGD